MSLLVDEVYLSPLNFSRAQRIQHWKLTEGHIPLPLHATEVRLLDASYNDVSFVIGPNEENKRVAAVLVVPARIIIIPPNIFRNGEYILLFQTEVIQWSLEYRIQLVKDNAKSSLVARIKNSLGEEIPLNKLIISLGNGKEYSYESIIFKEENDFILETGLFLLTKYLFYDLNKLNRFPRISYRAVSQHTLPKATLLLYDEHFHLLREDEEIILHKNETIELITDIMDPDIGVENGSKGGEYKISFDNKGVTRKTITLSFGRPVEIDSNESNITFVRGNSTFELQPHKKTIVQFKVLQRI